MNTKLHSNALILWLVVSLFIYSMPAGGGHSSTSTNSGETADRKVTRIPFEMNGNHIHIQGRINNSQPLSFVLDTGASGSVINADRARELGLQLQPGSVATGAGGAVESSLVRDVTFSISNVKIAGLTLATLPLNYLEDISGRKMDVILGAELFKNFVVEIDYETKHLTLTDPRGFAYTGKGEILPLTFVDNHPYVRARLELPKREIIEGDFVIDLGSNLAVALLPSFIEKHQLLRTIEKTIVTRVRGVGGDIQLPIGRIDGVQIGWFRLENPVTVFPSSGTFGGEGKAGNIGSAIMRRFKVIFDYSRQRMILEPNKFFRDPFEYDMSGLSLATKSPHFTSIKVLRVISDSPAAASGVKVDDEIIAVNGRPVSEIHLMQMREMFKNEGRSYDLSVKRGRETLQIKFTTRRLI